MKKLFLTALLGCGLSAFAADPYFDQATKHVDFGGEMLSYQNTSAISAELNSQLPEICAGFCKDDNSAVLASDISKLILRLLDLSSLRAVAVSSKQIAPDVFVFKQAVIFDPETKSILVNPANQNRMLTWQNLPADTRLALEIDLNIPHAWNRIKSEIAASGNPDIQKLQTALDELKNNGVDLDQILDSATGRFSLLVTGNNLHDLNIRVVIPDQNNLISSKLKPVLPPRPDSNTFEIVLAARTIQVVYAEKSIVVVTDPKLLAAPERTLVSLPQFQQFAKQLPDSGCNYFIMNMPQDVMDFINLLKPELHLDLKPFSFVAIGSKIPGGEKLTVASDFSLVQMQMLWMLKPIQMLQQAGAFAE
ncbi:MAG: hypothetical protein E7041_09715 [Lentisphaerae bacterium]|nr:hypothetical protein [Lentisphaerota bacterium]